VHLSVGLISGLSEFIGYFIRFIVGYFSDRLKLYWFFTLSGYGLIFAIPLIGLTNTWQFAAVFIILERLGKALRSPTAAIKMHSAEAAVKCAEEAIQVLGGYGYTSENMVQMYWRDAKLYTIGAGTIEMMKLIISRDLETKYTTF